MSCLMEDLIGWFPLRGTATPNRYCEDVFGNTNVKKEKADTTWVTLVFWVNRWVNHYASSKLIAANISLMIFPVTNHSKRVAVEVEHNQQTGGRSMALRIISPWNTIFSRIINSAFLTCSTELEIAIFGDASISVFIASGNNWIIKVFSHCECRSGCGAYLSCCSLSDCDISAQSLDCDCDRYSCHLCLNSCNWMHQTMMKLGRYVEGRSSTNFEMSASEMLRVEADCECCCSGRRSIIAIGCLCDCYCRRANAWIVTYCQILSLRLCLN